VNFLHIHVGPIEAARGQSDAHLLPRWGMDPKKIAGVCVRGRFLILQRGRRVVAHRADFTIRPGSAAGRTGHDRIG
jgi:hypothetical protein